MCIYCQRFGVDIRTNIKSSLYSMIHVLCDLNLRYEMKQRVRSGSHHMPHRCWALMLYRLRCVFVNKATVGISKT